jgi:hypothetical protein
MNATQRVFTILFSIGFLAVMCQATALGQQVYYNSPGQTNVVVVQTNVVVMQTNAAPTEEEHKHDPFHAGELDLSPYAVYIDRLPGPKWGGGAALTYYPIRVLGIGASSYLTNFKGTAIDNVEGEAYLRLPLGCLVAPYGVGGAGYAFDTRNGFETVGLGIDVRPERIIGFFGDAQYRFSNNQDRVKNGILVRIGVRFVF